MTRTYQTNPRGGLSLRAQEGRAIADASQLWDLSARLYPLARLDSSESGLCGRESHLSCRSPGASALTSS